MVSTDSGFTKDLYMEKLHDPKWNAPKIPKKDDYKMEKGSKEVKSGMTPEKRTRDQNEEEQDRPKSRGG